MCLGSGVAIRVVLSVLTTAEMFSKNRWRASLSHLGEQFLEGNIRDQKRFVKVDRFAEAVIMSSTSFRTIGSCAWPKWSINIEWNIASCFYVWIISIYICNVLYVQSLLGRQWCTGRSGNKYFDCRNNQTTSHLGYVQVQVIPVHVYNIILFGWNLRLH